MRVAIYTLGCKVNQYETQAMEAELTRRGHTLAPFDGEADAYIIRSEERRVGKECRSRWSPYH